MTLNEATCSVDPNLSVKLALGIYLFSNTLLSLGTERHIPIYEAVWNKKVITNIFCYNIHLNLLFLIFKQC